MAGSLPISRTVSRAAATRTLDPYFQACAGSARTFHVGDCSPSHDIVEVHGVSGRRASIRWRPLADHTTYMPRAVESASTTARTVARRARVEPSGPERSHQAT